MAIGDGSALDFHSVNLIQMLYTNASKQLSIGWVRVFDQSFFAIRLLIDALPRGLALKRPRRLWEEKAGALGEDWKAGSGWRRREAQRLEEVRRP